MEEVPLNPRKWLYLQNLIEMLQDEEGVLLRDLD